MSKITEMRIRATEKQVEEMTEFLLHHGFEYDGSFTTLYGAEWKIVGLIVRAHHKTIVRMLVEEGFLEDAEDARPLADERAGR